MDRLKTMESFVRVVKAGSFAGAGTQLGVSRAIISKHLQDLEDYLGARLFHRTTRRLSLTEIGLEYYGFCTRILDEMESEREDVTQLQREPRGTIKLMAPKSFGNLHIGPAIADFIGRYPEVHVSMLLSDDSLNSYDLVDNGIDLAIRLSPVTESSAVARRIGMLRWVLCSSPKYLKAHGTPRHPDDLARHNCLVHLKSSPDSVWRFKGPRGEATIKVAGSLSANSSLALRAGVKSGLGIALLPAYCIGPDLKSGNLIEVMTGYHLPERPVFALYPHRRHLPHKVRLLIDFLAERFRDNETLVGNGNVRRPAAE